MGEIRYQDAEFENITAFFNDSIASISMIDECDTSHSSTSSALSSFSEVVDEITNVVAQWDAVLERDGRNRVVAAEMLKDSDAHASGNFSG